MSYFHVHAHSQYSSLDGMSKVQRLVDKAHRMQQPALALTDHGNMAGTATLYQECIKLGMLPFPGIEAYLIDPRVEDWKDPKRGEKVGRFHLGLLALTQRGYQSLVRFTSHTHTRPNFSRFPRCTLNELAQLGKDNQNDIALTTGCFFGLVQQTLVDEGEDAALKVVKMYANWFPHTFVELQNHNIDHPNGQTDEDLVKLLVSIADRAGLPVVAGQDAHYCDQPEKVSHALMKRMVYSGSADDEFPGDSFHLASTDWVEEHYTPDQWAAVLDGHAELLDLNRVKIPPLDKFVIDVPSIIDDPATQIEKDTRQALERYLENIPEREHNQYIDQWNYELDVIEKLDMPTYFVIVQDFTRWCRSKGICIEARGSANGSLVCFLMDITQADPIYWGTMFDRFLSVDRIKPPDIDIDIEDDRRPEAIEYFKKKYGAVQIGTWGALGITVDQETGEERGSVLQTWLAGKRRECEAWGRTKADKVGVAKELGAKLFQKKYAWVKSIEDVRQISPHDFKALKKLNEMNSVYKSYGKHAGGVLLSGDRVKIEDYIPTMLVASSESVVTQFDMDVVELFGLLKMDVLGQATLRTMRICQELIGREDPIDFSWIPNDDAAACKLLREGRPGNGIFHFEGYTKAYGGREMGIRSTRDAILASALFMPGAMDTGQKDLYLLRRKDRKARAAIQYLHPVFERALAPTYGAVVFQEQVIDIMRGLGMDIAGINKFFKIVKDSGKGAVARNKERMEEVHQQFSDLCRQNGIKDVEAAWAQTAGFVAYGFNMAHATGYGLRSYRCAYLKAHYPLEFMTALLQTWAGRGAAAKGKLSKEDQYIKECRRMRIGMLPPDVQVSGVSWTLDPEYNAIRRGLVSIRGIGDVTAKTIAHHAPFTSIEDMIERVPPKALTGGKKYLESKELTGTLKCLYDADALDGVLKGKRL